jgi:hypothetical protein
MGPSLREPIDYATCQAPRQSKVVMEDIKSSYGEVANAEGQMRKDKCGREDVDGQV